MALNVTLTFPRSHLTGLTTLRLELNEAISATFEFVINVESTDHGIDMRKVVGEGIVVNLNDEPLLSQMEGFVRRVDQLTSEPTGQSQYRLLVVPPLWLSTRRRDHRIFKDLSVPEIVAAVLAGYAGRIAPPTVALGANHPKREYTVQYGETDHDFILRLLADEGIASLFDHGSRSAWTLVDDTTAFTPSVAGQIPFVPASLLAPRGPFVSAVSVRSEIDTSEVGLRDYDFEKPELMLQSKALATGNLFSNDAALESYEFEVGNFLLQPEADARAEQLLQEARVHRRVLACETNFALGAGTRFSLTGHPRSDVDGNLLVVRAQTVLDARTTSTTTRPEGAATVFIEQLPAVRVGDHTTHQGRVETGSGTVFIGGPIFTIPANISIRGDSEFQNQVVRDLFLLSTTASGKDILKRLADAGVRITIIYYDGQNGFCAAEDYGAARRGEKTGSVIHYNPDAALTVYDNNSRIVPGPPQVILGHEMVHALNNAEGKQKFGADPNPPSSQRDINEEEAQTIGVGSHAADAPTENSIRDDLGLPRRGNHFGWKPPPAPPTNLRPGKY